MEKTSLKEEEKSVEKDSLLKKTFPKSLRISRKKEFQVLRLSKNRLKGTFLILDYKFKENNFYPKLGITISSKIAKAHIRNKFKRRIREIFRLNQHNLYKNIEIHIIFKSISKNPNYQDLKKDFLHLISSIQK